MKKITAIILVLLFAFSLLCGCRPQDKEAVSSKVTSSEVGTSSVTTSSAPVADEEKPQQDSSTQKENNSSKTSSRIFVGRPGGTSASQSVKVSVADRMDVVMCGFATSTADYYGPSREEALYEMEQVIAAGYVNALSVGVDGLRNQDIWELVVKYDLGVWCSAWAVFNSQKQSLEDYMDNINQTVDFIKQNDEWWSRFKGFWYDEKVWRRETNEDFIAETKYVYQKFGKRTYAVLATGEFSPIEGNAGITGESVATDRKIKPAAFEFVTDVAFDSYGIDVRDGALNDNIAERYEDIMPGIIDGKTYYIEYTKRLLEMIDHPVNLWYLPCAYTCSVSGGLDGIKKADEDYCLAQLNFFYDQLYQRKYSGGLMLYVYGLTRKSEAAGTKGLQHFFVVEDEESGELAIHPETPKWRRYSKRLLEIVEKYNSRAVDVVSQL